MAAHFTLKKAANGQYMFNLVAGNNEIVLTSEQYSSKAAAEAGIASVKHNAPTDGNFERKTAKDGSPFFVLKSAANGLTIGRSETYSAVAAMEKGIKAVMTAAASATTKEV
jgi:uncharacterized protein